MPLSARFRSLLLTALLPAALLLTGASSFAKPSGQSPAPSSALAPAPSATLQPMLPTDFAGWHRTDPHRSATESPARANADPASPVPASADPASADSTNRDALKEYGFTRFEKGEYTRDTSKLDVHAIRFADATGAYGAYTFYRRSGMPREDIGLGGASDNNRVLFWIGNTVIDAAFDHLTSMSAAELRELAKDLTTPDGAANVPPPLPRYLPTQALDAQSTHYALGDAGYTRGGGVLPAALVDFNRGAEAITAVYHMRSGEGTLTLLNYPTPQLAAGQVRAIEAFLAAGNSPHTAWPQGLAQSKPSALTVRRTGPIVAVTSGSLSAEDAHKLAAQVNYTAEVTWDHPQGYISEAAKAGRMLIGIATLSAVLCGGTFLLGIFLGGGRALYRRMRGRPLTAMEEMEFISLNLDNYPKADLHLK